MADINAALESMARARKADPLAPATVIVPSHVAGLQLRRRLAELGPFAGIRFEALPRIAELLGAGRLAAAGRVPLARPIGDYLAAEVARESRGPFANVAGLAGYARVLRQLFRRLRQGGVHGSSDVDLKERTSPFDELLRLYDRFRAESEKFYDEEDLLEAAAAAVRSGGAEVVAELGEIYVAPPGAQSAGSVQLLDALRAAAPAFHELDDATSDAEVRFVLAPDSASEAREAVRETLGALESGCSLHEVAVLHGAGEQYGRLLREAFDAADVPAVYLPGVPLIDTPAGRGVLALAELPDRDYSRTAVMDFLSVAPLRPWLPGRDGDVQALSSLWDKLSREAGITHGLERWSEGLGAFVSDREQSLQRRLADENEARSRALEFERDHAGTLQQAIEALAGRLQPLAQDQPAATFVERFKRIVEEYFDPEARALQNVIFEIDQLGTVGAVRGTFSLAAFTQSLRANLELATNRERSLGEGVMIADYRMAGGLQFRHVVLCGAYEGALPARPGADTLIADSAWAQLRERFPQIEDTKARLERAERAAAVATASAGAGTLIWSCPLNEAGGTREYYPSRVMVEAAQRRDQDLTTASKLRQRPAAEGWLRHGASPLALQLAGPIVDVSELRLRDAISLRRSGGAAGDGHARWRSVAMLRARRSARFTEWDGNLAQLDEPEWLALQRAVSPTSLEHYAVCGYRYLCRTLLRLDVIDEPEERELMDPAARGSLIHDVLDKFFREQQQRGRPVAGEAWTDEDLAHLIDLTEQGLTEAKRRGLGGLDIYGEHELRAIRADLATFLEKDAAFRRRTGALPADFEVPIPEVTIGGATLRGYVDRIDRSANGKIAWVIDYKTGSKRPFEAIKPDDPLAGGTKLQLPTYVLAAQDADEVRAAYWFITHKGEFEFIEYEPTPENQALFERTVGAIVDGVRSGAFPAVSGQENEFYGGYDNCTFCDFDRICSRRREDEFAEKRADEGIQSWARVSIVARRQEPS